MTAALSERLEAFIQAEVATGHYATREDVIAAAVHQMQLRSAESGEMANLRLVLAEADGDFDGKRVRQFADEPELRAFAEVIKSRGRVRLTSGQALSDRPESVSEADEIRNQEFDEALAKTNRKYGRALKKLAE